MGWPDAPSEFGLQQLSGDLDLNVRDGHIRDVRPGAGRILGLFSLTEIPRRLSLDFGDLFQQGLVFNSIRARFYLEGGAAFTDSLLVLSPAAEIQISGRTGLVDRDYDQEMRVLPAVGGSLPLAGALAAGPAGAAAGLLMQGVFNDPLRRAAATRYRIRGSWESPEVDLVERPRDTR
ncbi:MAG: AsmA-like C-terminal region-containing protein [Chromatocurvus sp.]